MRNLLRPQYLRQASRSLTAPRWPRPYATMNTPGAAETDTEAAAIANSSGITPRTLSATLREKLEASHVDINDISGTYTPSPIKKPQSRVGTGVLTFSMCDCRGLRPSLRSNDRLSPIREEEYPRSPSSGQFGTQGGDRGHPCLDAEVHDARGVGEEASGDRGGWVLAMGLHT